MPGGWQESKGDGPDRVPGNRRAYAAEKGSWMRRSGRGKMDALLHPLPAVPTRKTPPHGPERKAATGCLPHLSEANDPIPNALREHVGGDGDSVTRVARFLSAARRSSS